MNDVHDTFAQSLLYWTLHKSLLVTRFSVMRLVRILLKQLIFVLMRKGGFPSILLSLHQTKFSMHILNRCVCSVDNFSLLETFKITLFHHLDNFEVSLILSCLHTSDCLGSSRVPKFCLVNSRLEVRSGQSVSRSSSCNLFVWYEISCTSSDGATWLWYFVVSRHWIEPLHFHECFQMERHA